MGRTLLSSPNVRRGCHSVMTELQHAGFAFITAGDRRAAHKYMTEVARHKIFLSVLEAAGISTSNRFHLCSSLCLFFLTLALSKVSIKT